MPPADTESKTSVAEPVEVSASDARDRLTELLNRAAYGGERIVITKNGKPIAMLVGIDAA